MPYIDACEIIDRMRGQEIDAACPYDIEEEEEQYERPVRTCLPKKKKKGVLK